MKYKKVFLILVLVLIGLQAWFGYLRFRYPSLGINLESTNTGQWVVSFLDYDGEKIQLDVRPGDRIIRIDENEPELHSSVQKWRMIEQADQLEIERDGERILLDLRSVENSFKHDVLPIFVEIICFLSAFLLYKKVKNSKSALFLAILFVDIGITFMCLLASSRGDMLAKLLLQVALSLVPVAFLHFLAVFFKEKSGVSIRLNRLRFIYIPVVVQGIVWISWIGRDYINYEMFRFNASLCLLTFLCGMLINFSILFYFYYKYRHENSHLASILRFVIVAMVVSFSPVVSLSFIPTILYGNELVSSYITSWFVLIFPLAFAYLIVTKQIYDIHMVLRRVAFTIVMAMVPALLLTSVNFIFFYEFFSIRIGFWFFVFCLIMLTFLLYTAEHIYTRMERLMFPRKYLLQTALKKIAKNLTTASSFRDLKDLILVDIVNTLEVYGGAIVIKHQDHIELIREGDIDESEVKRMVGDEELAEHPDLIGFEINRNEAYTSYLIMTHKRANTHLVLEEVQWLGLIVSYLAVSLENVYLIRKLTDRLNENAAQLEEGQDTSQLSWFRKLAFELQERERMRIAADMHDTTMQDLFHLKRKIASLNDIYELPPKASEQVRSLVDYVEIINVTLRQNCFDLHPYLLQEIGLIRTIEKIVERESYASSYEIRFESSGAYAIERKSLDTKRHLFRIVQELLNNARKHSQAKIVALRLSVQNGWFHLSYEDDGVGYDPKQTMAAASSIRLSGVGMEQLRSRILHLQGKIETRSQPGEGVRIRISFPLKEELSA